MPIPIAKVKAICTSAEAALVRASRGPVLNTLSPTELKKQAVQARKLFDKWQGLARAQARDGVRQSGISKVDPNTQLKEQIFREALDALEGQLAKDNPAAAKAKAVPPKSKQQRAVEHRTTRAVVRKKLSAVETKLNAPTRTLKKAPPAPPAPTVPMVEVTATPQPGAERPMPSVKPATKKPRAAKPVPSATLPVALKKVPVGKQRAATTAAKHSRLAQSGKVGRTVGHSTARGKRSQARRDSKG